MAKRFYQHPDYKNLYYDSEVKTPVGRFGFPSLVKPKPFKGESKDGKESKPRFEITLYLQKDRADVVEFKKLLEGYAAEMLEQYNQSAQAKLAALSVFQDGDSLDESKYPFAKNMWVLQARNTSAPGVINELANLIEPGTIKGGMKGRLLVVPFISPGHGIKFSLKQVQCGKDDGVRFAGGIRDAGALLGALTDDDAEAPEAKDTEVPKVVDNKPQPIAAATSGKQKAIAVL